MREGVLEVLNRNALLHFNHTICSTMMGHLPSHSLTLKKKRKKERKEKNLLQKLIELISSRHAIKQMPLVFIFFNF